MKLSADAGIVVLLNRFKYSIMSDVCKPTEAAAYNEYEVSLYSCICCGLHTGF